MTDQPDWSPPGSTPPPPPGSGAPRAGSGWEAPSPGYGVPPASPGYGSQPPPEAGGWGPPSPGVGQPAGGAAAAPRPGVIPLRPLGIGEILDGAISAMRTYPKAMLGLSLVVALITNVISVPLLWLALRDLPTQTELIGSSGSDVFREYLGGVFGAIVVDLVLTLIALMFLTGFLTIVVSRAVLGAPVTIGEAAREARGRLPSLFGVTSLIFLIVAAVFLATSLIPIVLAIGGASGATVAGLFALSMLAGFLLGIYVYVLLALAPVAVVIERQGVVASLKRSRALVAGAWWRTFWILVLVYVIAAVISTVLSLPFGYGANVPAMLSGDVGETFGLVPLMISAVGSIIGSMITWPFTAAGIALVYVDRRMRREGFDLELSRAAESRADGGTGWSGGHGPPGPTYGA